MISDCFSLGLIGLELVFFRHLFQGGMGKCSWLYRGLRTLALQPSWSGVGECSFRPRSGIP